MVYKAKAHRDGVYLEKCKRDSWSSKRRANVQQAWESPGRRGLVSLACQQAAVSFLSYLGPLTTTADISESKDRNIQSLLSFNF